mmetsp:Transcript_14453/g.35236  ORF Transcript_14453/g.35236 Transcript_14453/m.35236 type:complete len:112 (-) Transcript_14453:324-659(-)
MVLHVLTKDLGLLLDSDGVGRVRLLEILGGTPIQFCRLLKVGHPTPNYWLCVLEWGLLGPSKRFFEDTRGIETHQKSKISFQMCYQNKCRSFLGFLGKGINDPSSWRQFDS